MMFLLVACAEKEEPVPADTEPEPEAPLADLWVGIVAPVADNLFNTTCTLTVDVYDAAGEMVVATSTIGARGGEWTGVRVPPDTQYMGIGSWSSCNNSPNGTGSFESALFSGVAGDSFIFRYDGTTSAFEYLQQRADFYGGHAVATFEEGTDVATLFADRNPTAEGAEWTFDWMDTTPVGEVLATLSADPQYVSGGPVWIVQPEWW